MWIESSHNTLTGGTHLVFLSDKRNTSKSISFADAATENRRVAEQIQSRRRCLGKQTPSSLMWMFRMALLLIVVDSFTDRLLD